MRAFYYTTLFLLLSAYLQAQDTLYKRDGTKLAVKVIEVNESQVKYKLASNPEGPTYVLGKENVLKIVYLNGTIETFPKQNTSPLYPVRKIDPRATDFGRNFISLNASDLLFGLLTFGYEYTSTNGDYSFKFPLSIGISEVIKKDPVTDTYTRFEGYYNWKKTFSTGADFYFYPNGQGKAKYFFGPSLEYGEFYQWLSINTSPPNAPYSTRILQKEKGLYYAFHFQTGFLFQPIKQFNFSMNLGLGYSRLKFKYNTGDQYGQILITEETAGKVTARIALSVGYKF